MWFGQLIIGPPGSGKSTYVAGVEHILKQINRKLVLINLDPFVENDVYKADVNISELVDIKKVFCDLGQIHLELPHVNVFSKIDLLKYFRDDLNFPLSYYVEAQNLEQLMLYARYQNEPSSESDMGDSPSTSLNDPNHCTQHNIKQVIQNEINTGNIKNVKKNYRRFSNKYLKLNEYICETVEDYNIINFALLDIQDKYSVLKLLKIIDGANGFRFSSIYSEYSLFDTYVEAIEYDCDDIQERIVDVSDEEKLTSLSRHPPRG
ncbi:hypothetical protein PCYB_072530 [Plasmodium cynomolgi strain B]|uniref:GPN-loop GTPase 2 n=1 Tax=Plasmodium cynomolgi (strain B) TaxID=1120755 RepID=K6UD03_PLACD|nr:hypothetical protein PCYB_072530 [Plasmodium cynomolgi strain B]GAB65751.1 hypothetical protein PCYB_072530 [Plasmodium cynomolgi strain B]